MNEEEMKQLKQGIEQIINIVEKSEESFNKIFDAISKNSMSFYLSLVKAGFTSEQATQILIAYIQIMRK